MGFPAVVTLAPLVLCAPQQGDGTGAPTPMRLAPEVVLAGASSQFDADSAPLSSYGLGNGGLDRATRPGALHWSSHGCTTPGGIRVQCHPAGVKLTFPSGRELLLAPDGVLHLRCESKAGPFEAGVELRLGDGSAVRVSLSQAQRNRVRDVVVVHGDRALQPWRRGRPANEIARVAFWGGVRVCCCGDGGDLYRAIAIGPLITLDRILVPADRSAEAPQERLVVLTEPLLRALRELPTHHRSPESTLRAAVAAVAATAARGDSIFPAGSALQRAERESLRWALRGGYELELALDGPRAPRLALFAGRSVRPMVEWALSANSAAFLTNPDAGQPGASRWRGNGVPMPMVAAELQVRDAISERSRALAVIRRLER